jgi:hypothetical protein
MTFEAAPVRKIRSWSSAALLPGRAHRFLRKCLHENHSCHCPNLWLGMFKIACLVKCNMRPPQSNNILPFFPSSSSHQKVPMDVLTFVCVKKMLSSIAFLT